MYMKYTEAAQLAEFKSPIKSMYIYTYNESSKASISTSHTCTVTMVCVHVGIEASCVGDLCICLLVQITEMYSSGGDLHLELLSGQLQGSKSLWVSEQIHVHVRTCIHVYTCIYMYIVTQIVY